MRIRVGALPLFLFAFFAVGCAPQGFKPGSLPVHNLDWGHSTAANVPAPKTRYVANYANSASSGESAWAVSGYREWRYIVIHHSASAAGSAAQFDAEHRRRGWDELGYHFVIDNGNGGPDGMIEVGPRWREQKWGAHTGKTPGNEYNYHGIGICLVGDFTNHAPTAAQLESLNRLVNYLMAKYNIPPENVIGHRDAPGAKTECPGNVLWSYIHTNYRSSYARRGN